MSETVKQNYTREELEKELADAILASSKIEELTEALRACDEGRLLPHDTVAAGSKKTPYGNITIYK